MVALVVAGVISAILGLISGALAGGIITGFFGAIIGTIIGFFVGQAIVFVLAKIVGGNGGFMEQSWVLSTFMLPLGLLASVPFVGPILGLVGGIYSLYLMYLALQPAHRLDSSKAMIVVGILIAVVVVLGVCAVLTGAAAMFGLAAASTARP